MKRTTVLLAAMVVCLVGRAAADYSVSDRGEWPDSWPKELEPLRTQSRTLEGPLAPNLHYAIRFTTREEFEPAWPHLLKVKDEGAPLVLKRGENFFLGEGGEAGVVVHCPPAGERDDAATPKDRATQGGRSLHATYIELVVDGDIVDLNRIPLPKDTPIMDERFAVVREPAAKKGN